MSRLASFALLLLALAVSACGDRIVASGHAARYETPCIAALGKVADGGTGLVPIYQRGYESAAANCDAGTCGLVAGRSYSVVSPTATVHIANGQIASLTALGRSNGQPFVAGAPYADQVFASPSEQYTPTDGGTPGVIRYLSIVAASDNVPVSFCPSIDDQTTGQ